MPPESFDEYRLIKALGRGSMGQVWLAHDTVLDRLVAVKFIADLPVHDAARQRLLTEARAAARVQHPNIIAAYRVGEIGARPYLISEYVRGDSLDRIARPVAWPRLLEIAIGLARGLAAAHHQGVLHRDLKPANAMLSETGEVKLLDFGLAKLLPHVTTHVDAPPAREAAAALPDPPSAPPRASCEPSATLDQHTETIELPASASADSPGVGIALPSVTTPGAVMGTPAYMSPEAWRGEPATPRSDVYSLGAMLYELGAGAPPHRGDSRELGRAALAGDALPLAGAAPGIDPGFAAVVDRCLQRDPTARFASGDAVREALEALTARSSHELDAPRDREPRSDGLPASATMTGVLRPGTQLAGRYRILELVGAGGMGAVYRARDLTLELDIALKVLHPAIAHDPAKIAFFRNEVRVARKVTHPNVCRLHDLVDDPGGCFITMEYIAGESLSARLARERLALPDALRVLRDVASGLAAAHAAGVIHRDLKPSNVLLAGDRAIVVDFGIAGDNRALAEGPQDIAGTRGDRVPEQRTGAPIEPRVDVHAFGVLAFVLLTGRRPPRAATHTVPSGGPAALLPVAEIAPHLEDLPAELAALIADCLAPPEGRPRDAGEVLRRLDAATPHRGLWWRLPLLTAAVAVAGVSVALAARHREPPAAPAAPAAPRIVLSAVDTTALSAQDGWLGPVMQRLLADELIDVWGLEVELGRPPTSAPGTLVVATQLARNPSGRLRLVVEGTTLEAATSRKLAVAAAERLVSGHVPSTARHPTAAELAAVGAHDPDAWRLWRRAEHEALLMRFDRAHELCLQALARDPTFPVASFELAVSELFIATAGRDLAHAAELMDRVPVAPLWRLALTAVRQVMDRNLIGAALTMQELFRLDLSPRERLMVQLRWVLARTLLLGAPASTVAPDLVRMTENYPDHPAAYRLLAEIYLSSDEPTATTLAVRYATRAAALAPEDPDARADLAVAILRAGRRDEARALADQLDRLEPEDQHFVGGTIFELHMALGDLAAAEIDARRALAGMHEQHAHGLASLAQIDLYWGRFEAGLHGLASSADEFDGDGDGYWAANERDAQGRHAWLLGDRATARGAFEQVAAGHSRRAPMARVRARIATGALDEARAAVAEFPDGSVDRAAGELALADAVHDAAGVLAAFARVEQLSTTAEHMFAAADALERSRRPDEAAAMYERLIHHARAWQEPIATTRAWSRLGHLRERAGDVPGALAAYAEVVRRWGNATAPMPEVGDARRRLRALHER